MTCYARPLAFLFLLLGIAMIAAGMFGTLAVLLGVTGVSALAAVIAVALIVRVTTSRRAASGACTTCRHQCQGEPVVVVADLKAARWPDRPAMSGPDLFRTSGTTRTAARS